jgi:hypothetical protein
MPSCPSCFDYTPDGENICQSCGYIFNEENQSDALDPNIHRSSDYEKYKTKFSDTEIYHLFHDQIKSEDPESKDDKKIDYIMSNNSYVICNKCKVSIEFAFVSKTIRETHIEEIWKCVKCNNHIMVKKQLTEKKL